MNYNEKQKTLLVSAPGIIREATTIMLESIPQVGDLEIVSGSLSAIELLQNGNAYLLVIDANLEMEEMVCLVRWTKQHRPKTRCIVLVRGVAEQDQVRAAGADAVLLRSSSAHEMTETLWPKDGKR